MGALASNAVVVVGEHVDELVAIEAADAVQNIGGHLPPTAARNTAPCTALDFKRQSGCVALQPPVTSPTTVQMRV